MFSLARRCKRAFQHFKIFARLVFLYIFFLKDRTEFLLDSCFYTFFFLKIGRNFCSTYVFTLFFLKESDGIFTRLIFLHFFFFFKRFFGRNF